MRYTLVVLIALLAASCGGPENNNPITTLDSGIDTTPVDPCANVNCGVHGTCSAGICVCTPPYSGVACNRTFDTSQCLNKQVFGPADSGQLVITGMTGNTRYLEGTYIDVPKGTVGTNALFCLLPAFGANIPVPVPTGEKLRPGLEILALDPNQPLTANGKPNSIPLVSGKRVKLCFHSQWGRIQHLKDNAFEQMATTLTENGVSATTESLSEFYLFDKPPVITVTATTIPGTQDVLIDGTGTSDEGFTDSYLFSFSAAEGGTPLKLNAVTGSLVKFTAKLAVGIHTLTIAVRDPYGNVDSKQIDVTVGLPDAGTPDTGTPDGGTDTESVLSDGGTDEIVVIPTPDAGIPEVNPDSGTPDTGTPDVTPPADVTDAMPDATPPDTTPPPPVDTRPGPEAGPEAGKEAGQETQVSPCTPNPCQHGGGCTVIGGISYICACTGGWTYLSSCTVCGSGWSGANCDIPPPDPCDGVSCSGNSHCSGGNCYCNSGYVGSYPACYLPDSGTPDTLPPVDTRPPEDTTPPVDTTPVVDTTPGLEAQVPAPVISGLAIDCSSTDGFCNAGGNPYPLNFAVTNATTCTGTAEKIAGGSGTPGSVSNCVIDGSTGTATYTTGSTGSNTIRITIQVTGPGGQASAYIDRMLD